MSPERKLCDEGFGHSASGSLRDTHIRTLLWHLTSLLATNTTLKISDTNLPPLNKRFYRGVTQP